MVNHVSILGKIPKSTKSIPEIRTKCTLGNETFRFPFSKDKTLVSLTLIKNGNQRRIWTHVKHLRSALRK